jgi:hypothetical protein
MQSHQIDVFHILTGNLGDRDIQDIQIVLADQIKQEIKGPLEGFQDHFQRVGRDEQVFRPLGQRRTRNDGKTTIVLLEPRHPIDRFDHLRRHLVGFRRDHV